MTTQLQLINVIIIIIIIIVAYVIQHATRMRHIVIYSLPGCTIFLHVIP